MLENSLIVSFRQNPDAAKAHKEALPLPMAVVAAFERRVANPAATQWENIVLAFLFGDGVGLAQMGKTATDMPRIPGVGFQCFTWNCVAFENQQSWLAIWRLDFWPDGQTTPAGLGPLVVFGIE